MLAATTVPLLGVMFVVAVLVHNVEEALYLPAWSAGAGRWHAPVEPAVFRLAVGILSAALVVVATLAFIQGPQSAAAYLFFAYAFAMAANAVLPHFAATLVLRRYMPGTATGLLLNLPLGVVLLREGVNEGWVTLATLLWIAPACAVALAASIPVLFALGRRVVEPPRREA